MDEDDKNPVPGGGRPEDIGVVLLGGRTGGVAFRVRDVGPDPLYGVGPGQLPAQGRATAHREANKAEGGGEMVISSSEGSDGGSGF